MPGNASRWRFGCRPAPALGQFETPLVGTFAGRRVVLSAPLVYRAAGGGCITVPAGFASDLASMPAPAQLVIGKLDVHAPAAVLHDWLYATSGPGNRAEADALFLEAMHALAVPAWKRRLMWASVRLAGAAFFRRRSPIPAAQEAPMSVATPQLTVRDGWLVGGRVERRATPNVGGRMEPTVVVMHDTAGRDCASSVAWLCTPKAKASAHVVIGRDGAIVQLAPFDRVTWHAGKSTWRGRDNVNGWGIGIELDNPGLLRGSETRAAAWFGGVYGERDGIMAAGGGLWQPYTPAQLAACQAIVQAVVAAYPITEIIGHRDIAPGRKVDPTPLFPYHRMRAALGGRRPYDETAVREVQERLAALGYWPGGLDGHVGPRTRSALRDFQDQNGLAVSGSPDEATLGALMAETARPMVSGGREDVTAKDLRAGGSIQAFGAAVLKRGGEVVAAVAVGGGVAASGGPSATAPASVPASTPTPSLPPPDAASTADVLTRAGEIVTQAEGVQSLGQRVLALWRWGVDGIGTPLGLLVAAALVAAALVWWIGHRQEQARVRAARSGQHVGL